MARLLNLLRALPRAGRGSTWPQSGSSACSRPGTGLSSVVGDLLAALKGGSQEAGLAEGPPSCLPSAKEFEGSNIVRLEGLQALGPAAQNK